jgi:DNA-binding NtrC family response regulator
MPHKLLLVDDEPLNLDLLTQELADRGHVTDSAASGADALMKIDTFGPDLILLDYQMPGMNGIETLRELRKRGKDLPVIIMTAYGTIERAVEAMKTGADDFITKPFDPDHLALVVGKALERMRLKSAVECLSAEVGERYRLVAGTSRLMAQTVEEANKAATSKATVLLLGESGTGKELFARSIHAWSDRRSSPFVPINCVGLSKELLESELFGHERGAYTGAHQLKKGKMELADGGTVFLDEVGDISRELQTKLLRFLQEREFERVGGIQPIGVDVRIVAATNRDLERAVQDGHFREDLYHRLNVIAITLPPLRARKEDIPILAAHFLQRFSQETKKPFSDITADAQEKLGAYNWPGNVRELANVIERAVVLGEGPALMADSLPSRIAAKHSETPANQTSYHEAVNTHRRQLIVKALAEAEGNRAAAAKALGLHRTHLMKLMKALRIS